jgi:hypothetical protein
MSNVTSLVRSLSFVELLRRLTEKIQDIRHEAMREARFVQLNI